MPGSAGVPVSVRAAVDAPANLTAPAVAAILEDLQREPGRAGMCVDLALDLQAPIEVTVNVPVRLTVCRPSTEPFFDLSVGAATPHDYYPDFTGRLRVSAATAATCVLTLEGTYAVPLGALGIALDMTLLRGAAEASLARFLEYVARAAVERIRREQAEHARAALHFHV